jgi:DNA-binding CsgD family transcriptional regulator/tetratricopeptide (TPR) repeat protein
MTAPASRSLSIRQGAGLRAGGQGGETPGMPRMGGARMMGRDGELEVLTGLARDAASGRGRLVLVEGEPGIGKTSLLRALAEDAAGLFPRAVICAAEEFDQRLPFATVGSGLEPLAAGDRRAAEVLALIRGAGAEYPVIESVLALVEQWCAAGPVAVAVDDLHWADSASLLLLHRLGRMAGQLPLLLVAARRSGAGGPDVAALTRTWLGHGAAQLGLGPLPDAAVNRLVADLAGGPPGPALRGLVSGAAGNPLYLTELVSGLAQGSRLLHDGQVVDVDASSDHLGVSPTLGAAIARRLEFLSEQTRELLRVAALFGSAFAVADVAAVLGHPVTDLLGRVVEATGTGVLAELPGGLAFRHPLVRSVLADSLPSSARQALHGQIAQALVTRAAPERVAEHLLAAGPAAAPLLDWLAGAAGDIVDRAPALAAELFSKLLATVAPAQGEVSRRLRAALAAALLRTGQPGAAEQVARSALATPPDTRTEAALRWTLATACASQGAIGRAVTEIAAALATGRLTLAEQARFYGLDAQCQITLSEPTATSTSWRDSVAAARASGDTEALAYGMAAAARSRLWDGWIEEALGYADAAVTATEALGPRAGAQLAPHVSRGVCLAELDRDADAARAFEDALRLAERGVGTDYLAWRYLCSARLRFWQGRWEEALAEVQSGLDLPDLLDMGRHLRGVAALIAVHRRDRAALADVMLSLGATPPATSPGRQSAHMPAWALALAAYADDRPGEAAAILGQAWGEGIGRDRLWYLRHYLVPDLVAVTLAAGDPVTARRAADSIGAYAARHPVPALGRSARHARALAGQDADGLAEVAAGYQRAGRPLFAAQAREQCAPLLAAAGRANDARATLLEAVSGYESLEAGWDLARAETLLRTLGVRRGARGPRRRPKTGWDALTGTEWVVAGLVAEGLSNPAIAGRMFVSRRTVQGHVSAILGKLGVTSRVELATMVTQREAGAQRRIQAGADRPAPAG